MIREQQPALTIFAAGLLGLGVLALIYGDFALVWQPVAPWVPGRTGLAYTSGVLMLACGAGLLFNATAPWSARILFPYLILWLLLKVPALIVAPRLEAVWLGFGELAMLLAGGWILFAKLAALENSSIGTYIGGERGILLARVLFALSLIPVGLSHFFYLKQTAELVPAWLPVRTGWAALTGLGQIACGIGILFSLYPRLAGVAEAGMLTLFTLLVWGPSIWAAPSQRLPWTAFFISWIIGASAWVVAANTTSEVSHKERENASC